MRQHEFVNLFMHFCKKIALQIERRKHSYRALEYFESCKIEKPKVMTRSLKDPFLQPGEYKCLPLFSN